MSAFELEPVAGGGFGIADAPCLDREGAVWFSDVLHGGVFRIAPGAEAIDEVLPGRDAVRGMVAHERGGVVASGRDVVRVWPDGRTAEVFAADEETGITGFTACAVDRNGWLLAGAAREPEARVVVVGPRWVAIAVDQGVQEVHGLAFSADGTRCHVSDGRAVLAAGVDRDGAVQEVARPWATVPEGVAGGLAVDAEGGVWVATCDGESLVRLDPETGAVTAREAGVVTYPTALCFGGADGRDVVVCGADSAGGAAVWRGRATVSGTPLRRAVI